MACIRTSCGWFLLFCLFGASSSSRKRTVDSHRQSISRLEHVSLRNNSFARSLAHAQAGQKIVFTSSLLFLVLKAAYTAYQATDMIIEVSNFLNSEPAHIATTHAVEELSQIVNRLFETGQVDSEDVLRSQYLELQQIRKTFGYIQTKCTVPRGFLGTLFQTTNVSDEHSVLADDIAARVAEIDQFIAGVLDDVFCPSFGALLDAQIADLTRTIEDWEVATGLDWWPLREVPDVLLATSRNRKTVALLKKRYGLKGKVLTSVQENSLWYYTGPATNGGERTTTFSDTYLSHPAVSLPAKAIFKKGLHKIRLLFGEIGELSTTCRDNMRETTRSSKICIRCPQCCETPRKTPSLTAWFWGLFGDKADTVLEAQYIANNASSVVFAVTGSPCSIMWVARRLALPGTNPEHWTACANAFALMNDFPLPEAETEAANEWARAQSPALSQVLQLDLDDDEEIDL